MKTKFNGILTLLLAFVVQFTFAQSTISGTVSDDTGALPGVSIIIKGTQTGVETDFDGKYSITANAGDVLQYSFIGMTTVEKTVGSASTINVTMTEDEDSVLDEVIITAQGIKRETKVLGYAVSTLKAAELENKPETDIAKILTGKIAGVEVNTAGGFLGRAPNVIIRSKNSISGSNQPLYIVDGSPITGDRSFDLDPNNIASTSVLKGLAASVLYGEDGRNGVILITTKTGSRKNTDNKFEIELTNTFSMLEVANLPEFQNKYGQGSDNNINTTFFGTWGAAFNGQTVPHPLAIGDYAGSYPQFQGATVEYRAAPNNVSDFFKPAAGNTTSLLISKGNEDASFSFSVNNSDQTGYIRQNYLKKLNLSFGGDIKLSNKFSLRANATYSNTDSSRPTTNLFDLLTWIPRNLDIHNLPFQDPNTGESVYYRTTITNPRWQLNNTGFREDSRRFTGNATLRYKFNDSYNLAYTYSLDEYSERNIDFINRGAPNNILGAMSDFINLNRIVNHKAIFSGNNINLTDNFSVNGLLGFETRNTIREVSGINASDQVVFGFVNLENFREYTPRTGLFVEGRFVGPSEQNRIGVFGSVDFGYKDYLYLNFQARNDWASTVELENASVFYPSISMSFLPTAVFEGLRGGNNNFLKLRASYGTSASFPAPYLTRPTLNANPNTFIDPVDGSIVSTNFLNPFLPNRDLRPEFLREIEVGAEARLLKNRLIFDISAYRKTVEDQILFAARPNSTGYLSTVLNAGTVETKGFESQVIGIPIKTKNFEWSSTLNFTAYESTVTELPIERVDIASGINYAIEGQPFGVFRGSFAVKDDAGNILINPADGKIINSESVGLEDQLIGDPNEDFRLSFINSFSYKNFTLSAQLEYIGGGDIYSVTASNLLRRGVTRDTENRESTYIIPGVLGDPSTGLPILDGNGDRIVNTIQIGANDLYFRNLMDVDENLVYDATTFRIRDISLSYRLPKKFLEKTPFGSILLAVSGNNLLFITPNLPEYMNLDPEVIGSGAGNGKGLDFQNDPSYKQYSFTAKLTF